MMRRTRAALAIVVLVLITGLFGLAVPAAASADESADLDAFVFDSLAVDYTLSRDEDGTARMRVVETFVADFPPSDQNRGMRRLLPETYNGQPLHPELISVTDENGDARPVETDSEDGTLGILTRGPEYLHGPNTFVFTYDLENVVWDFPDTGLEFYWDVNGTDWNQPFRQVTATLRVDPAIADALAGRQACYVGEQDSTTPCPEIVASPDGTAITASATDLAPHETLTFAVGFEEGTFEVYDTGFLASPLGWLQSGSTALLAGATGWALRNRRRYLRDEPGRPTVIAEYAPPRRIDAIDAAVLLQKTSKAIPAEVLELALVGAIRIVDDGKSRWGRAKLQAELVDPRAADENGRRLLRGMFPHHRRGEVYRFGSSDTRLSTETQRALKMAKDSLRGRGMYKPVPAGVRGWPVAAWAIAAGLVILFGALALNAYVHPALPIVGIVLAATSFLVVVFAVAGEPLSDTGAEIRDHLRGLDLFIRWAEADRIRMLQSPTGAEREPVATDDPREMLRIYERLLPYAVLFGREKEWAAHLTALYGDAGIATPGWYVGTAAFDASSFAAGIGTLSSAASSSSTTSGGSSGGGSAGGGGGGGGGGGA
ncbi:DUF2207 domain-containing protein [Microbacterium arborescens]|uniref:DUF2207 domain-containing protein n=1 Tax=Microbacterium arborescens TaxID=33883 RepID=UPI001F071A7D|nr:DUF2207 domain-containing protein [Microbacterium arborescens]